MDVAAKMKFVFNTGLALRQIISMYLVMENESIERDNDAILHFPLETRSRNSDILVGRNAAFRSLIHVIQHTENQLFSVVFALMY